MKINPSATPRVHASRCFALVCVSAQTVSKTVEFDPKVMFIKVIVQNLDLSHDLANVKGTATLGNS